MYVHNVCTQCMYTMYVHNVCTQCMYTMYVCYVHNLTLSKIMCNYLLLDKCLKICNITLSTRNYALSVFIEVTNNYGKGPGCS